jgi:hypothetical protein
MMSHKTYRALILGLGLLACLMPGAAQEKTIMQGKNQKPQTISTTPKMLTGKLQAGSGKPLDIRGQMIFTITAANADDSIVGTLVYIIPDNARQKVSEKLGQPLTAIPANVTTKGIVTGFEKGAHCPEIRFPFGSMEAEVAGAKLHFDRFTLTLNESEQELSKLFCIWTSRVNSGRGEERGVVAFINRLLTGEEIEEKGKSPER